MGGDYYDPRIKPTDSLNFNDFWSEDDYKRKLGDKIDYYNTNTVDWLGGYAQSEYSAGKLTATGMGGLSAVKYSYTDHFNTADTLANGDPDIDSGKFTSESDWVTGYQFKGGLSYKLNNNIGIFGNAGYVNKCPILDEVINDWTGEKIEEPENEKFGDIETGFNFVGMDGLLNIKGDFYVTQWIDQAKSFSKDTPEAKLKIFVSGIDSRHIGAEFEAHARPIPFAKFDISFSKGYWKYLNDLKDVRYELPSGDEDTLDIYVKDLKVGGSPQTQLSIGTTILPVQGLRANLTYKYYWDYYSSWDPFSRQDPSDDTESWEIPDYGVTNLHVFYQLPSIVTGLKVVAFTHIFNLFDETYIQDATDNSQYNAWNTGEFPHTGSSAEVFFGLPRRFNAGISIKM